MGIKNKFLALIVLVSAILILVSGIGYYNSQKQLTNNIEQSLASIVENQAVVVDNWMMTKVTKMIAIADSMPSMPESMISSTALLNSALNDKDIEDFYNGRKSGEFIHSHELVPVPLDFNPTQRPWYQDTVAKNDLLFTSVYADIGTNKNIITAAIPYKDSKGTILGVIGLDITLDMMNKIVKT